MIFVSNWIYGVVLVFQFHTPQTQLLQRFHTSWLQKLSDDYVSFTEAAGEVRLLVHPLDVVKAEQQQ